MTPTPPLSQTDLYDLARRVSDVWTEASGLYRLDPADFGPDWAAECTAQYLDLVYVSPGPCPVPTWRTPDHYSVCEHHAREIAAQWITDLRDLVYLGLDLLGLDPDHLPDGADPDDVADVLYDTLQEIPDASLFLVASDFLEQVL